MTRTTSEQPSSTLHSLSFFVSDNQTTNAIDMNAIVNDDPAEIFIPTSFI